MTKSPSLVSPFFVRVMPHVAGGASSSGAGRAARARMLYVNPLAGSASDLELMVHTRPASMAHTLQ